MPSSLLFWDVDTQFDFMNPAGKLYVPGAETIISNLQGLTAFAAEHGIPIVASTDAHLKTDPEFSQYPPHCLAGTPGQRKVEGTLFPHHYIIPNRKIDLPGDLGCYPEIILEKQAVDVFANPNTDSLLKLLGDREIILYGVVTEICVDRAARGLILHDYRVHLVKDAIRHLDSHRGHATIQHVQRHGGVACSQRAKCWPVCSNASPDPHLELGNYREARYLSASDVAGNAARARVVSEAHISCKVRILDTHSWGPILQNPPTGPEYFSRGFRR